MKEKKEINKKNNRFLTGKQIYLRGLTKDDLKGNYFNWANDEEVTKYLFMGTYPNYLENLEEGYLTSIKNKNEIQFATIYKGNNELIGFCGIYDINWVSRSCETRNFIGEKEYWKKGLGTEASKLLNKYVFEKLNLNRIGIGCNIEHIGAVKHNINAGFIKEGILRQAIYRNSKYYDVQRFGLLREEYFKTKAKLNGD